MSFHYSVTFYAENPDERAKILKQKSEYREIQKDEVILNLLQYPGLGYQHCRIDEFEQFYNGFLKDLYCPPRGNITPFNYMVIGLAPGKHKLSFGESMWLLGPSSEILHCVLEDNNVYPYFTDMFKTPFKDENGQDTNKPCGKKGNPYYTESELSNAVRLIETEIKILKPSKIIFLGSYKEFKYIKIPDICSTITIWHPAYVRRQGYYENPRDFPRYSEWSKKLNNQISKLPNI